MSDKEFLSVYNNVQDYPSLKDVADKLGISTRTVQRKAKKLKDKNHKILDRKKFNNNVNYKQEAVQQTEEEQEHRKLRQHEIPMSEDATKYKDWSEEDCIAELKRIAEEHPDKVISRNYFRVHSRISESTWNRHFGTWAEFKRQAGIVLTRQQHSIEKHIAKHVSVDHYKELHNDLQEYSGKFAVPHEGRYKKILVGTDFHDKESDPFTLRLFLETAKRIQPDVICLGGDMWDAMEFGRYSYDVREFDLMGSLNFLHEEIMAQLRDVCPDAQIDYIAGNHEIRVLKHFADSTPALKVLLSEFHNMSFKELLGLDKYNVNFYCKGDLHTFTKADERKSVYENYIIYDDAFMVAHYPNQVKESGLAGVAGHHHKHLVWSYYNRIQGTYEVHQLGAGHRRYASYCNGDKWGNGFAVATVDKLNKSSVIEYYDTTNELACIAGEYYIREDHEK